VIELRKMLNELLKNREFNKIINQYLQKSEIIDIFLFGSSMKGKEKPQDIDFLILFNDSIKDVHDILSNLKKELGGLINNAEIHGKRYSEFLDVSYVAREALLSGAYSLKKKDFFSKSLGYSSFILFKYSLKNLNNSKRMQFYYSLYGRGKEKGMLYKKSAIKFSNEIILAQIDNSEIFKDFFDRWKIEYESFPIILPERLIKFNAFNK